MARSIRLLTQTESSKQDRNIVIKKQQHTTRNLTQKMLHARLVSDTHGDDGRMRDISVCKGFEEELCWVCDGLRSWVGEFSFSSARLHSPVFFLLTGNASVIAIAAAVKQLLLRMHKTPYGMSSMNWRGFAFVLT